MSDPTARTRLDSIDLLRGAVMILMALDHARDFFAVSRDPTNLASTTPVLFATRWVTHFCAPVFSFLAGTAAFLSASRGKPRRALSWFLFTRGLWLILLDVTIVRFGFFGLGRGTLGLMTLWALGGAMVALAPLVFLPTSVTAAIAIVILVGHNALDGVHGGALWNALHDGGPLFKIGGWQVQVWYPLLPWIGVMTAGWAFGEIVVRPRERRRRITLALGLLMVAAFGALRAVNHYGDPHPWAAQPRGALFTALAFLNCAKYPPSLDFVLMTLGPSLIVLAFLDGIRVSRNHFVLVFGRVPMFYYLLHLYVLHIPAWLWFSRRYGRSVLTFSFFTVPPDYGLPLGAAYLAWALAILALYPICRWYAGVKSRSQSPWLSYL